MKEYIAYALIIILLALMLIVPIYMVSNWGEATHTRTERMQVIEVNDGIYAVVDSEGEVWEFTSDRAYFVGEVLTVRFDTLGTETIFDDEIISVKS